MSRLVILLLLIILGCKANKSFIELENCEPVNLISELLEYLYIDEFRFLTEEKGYKILLESQLCMDAPLFRLNQSKFDLEIIGGTENMDVNPKFDQLAPITYVSADTLFLKLWDEDYPNYFAVSPLLKRKGKKDTCVMVFHYRGVEYVSSLFEIKTRNCHLDSVHQISVYYDYYDES